MDKLEADVLGRYQLKTVLQYAQYINRIASARTSTFATDEMYNEEIFWHDIKWASFGIAEDIEKVLNHTFELE